MKKILMILVALTLASQAGAQTLGFLQIAEDPAISGMAGAGVALPSLSPVDNNLAAAALGSEKLQAAASYTLWQPQIGSFGLVNVAASYRVIPKLVVALSVKDFMSPSYDITQANGMAGGSFKPMDLSIAAGAAYQITGALSAGVAVKYLSSSLGEGMKGSAVAANVSAKYAAGGLQVGLALNNLGGKISYGGDSYALPMEAKAGAAYTVAGFTASLEADYVFNAGLMAALGVEYGFKDMVFVRAGYEYGKGQVIPSHASLGLGLKLSGFHLDVSFLTASKTLGNTLAVGVGYAF